MKSAIQKILKKWEGNLSSNGFIDQRRYTMESEQIDTFISTSSNRKLVHLLASFVDNSHSSVESEKILRNVRHAIFLLQKEINKDKKERGLDINLGQRQRYASVSKRLYMEKLKFKAEKSLRESDVALMEGKDSRKVRRIVEKRMCQEYHRCHKQQESYRTSGKARHEMDRAVSYQIYNLGQLNGYENQRGAGSHWKKTRDFATGEYVMKKKVAYETLEEAKLHIELYQFAHPNEKRTMQAYYCEYCGKYHIGHGREEVEVA